VGFDGMHHRLEPSVIGSVDQHDKHFTHSGVRQRLQTRSSSDSSVSAGTGRLNVR
jgi:hypothetical protein